MIAARKMIENMREEVAKLPIKGNTTLSQPVIREENGRACIACIPIVIPDTLKETDMMPRPQIYILYELDGTGFCNPKAMPFTEDMFQGQFSNNQYYVYRPKKLPESVYDEMYLFLDRARQSLLENPDSDIYREAYDRYLAALCTTVPKAMQRLYRLLSKPPEGKDATKEIPQPKIQETSQQEGGQNMDISKEKDIEKEVPETQKMKLIWKPQVNLSTMPEMTYRMHERIAEQIEFLENKNPGQFRIAYPLYCFPKDRKMTGGVYQELLYTLKKGEQIPKGHMRIAPKSSIYAKCANAKEGCMFSSCPYIIAAYIRYLKDNDPEELRRQRESYKKKEDNVNGRYLKTLPFPVKRPKKIAQTMIDVISEGVKLIQLGCIEFGTAGEDLQVTWCKNENDAPTSITIPRAQLSDWHEDMQITDTNGKIISQEIYGAILAYDTLSNSSARLAGAAAKENADKAQTLDEKTSKQPVEHEKQAEMPPNEPSLADYMPKDGLTFRCLTESQVKTIYGTYETPVPVNETDGFVITVMNAMKTKGITDLEIMKGTSNSVPWANKICFVNLNGQTEFKTEYFSSQASVILCGRPADLQAVLANTAAAGIYGHLKAKRPEREYRALYDQVISILPDRLKIKAQDTTPADLISWMYENRMPRTEENNIAEYIAWRCIIADEVVFGEGKKRQ